MTGTQTIVVRARPRAVRGALELDYELSPPPGPLRGRSAADGRALHPAGAARLALRRTLRRFATEAEEEVGPVACAAASSVARTSRTGFRCSCSKPPSSAPAPWAARSPRSIASADIPVVLKDVDQKFVDQGLEKARQVTQGQLGGLVKKEKITQEQADEQLEEIARPDHRHDRLRRASATSTS